MSYQVQCPSCQSPYVIAQIPAGGAKFQCPRCTYIFELSAPAPMGVSNYGAGYSQAPQQPQYDPLAAARTQPRQPVNSGRIIQNSTRSQSSGVQPWMVAVGIGGIAALAVILIIAASVFSGGRDEPTPMAAAAPAVPTPPVLATTSTPAPTAPPSAGPMPGLPTPVAPVFSSTPAASTPFPAMAADPGVRERIRAISSIGEERPDYAYKFKAGEHHRYGIEIRMNDSDRGPGGRLGTVEYSLGTLPGKGRDQGPQQATGTAFVVHSQGLLATCHHVVAGASSIMVNLNGQKHKATVVALDKLNDLAIIRIDAGGLIPLPLADSNRVQLAEDVKAIGYPLSDVLGKNVKITTGTISGKAEGDQKVLQVDIAINPGNSGGPLVNMRGEVVGVNSAGLFGTQIQEVAFAVPSNLVSKLMETLSIKDDALPAGAALPGVELAAKVTPSTAFVEVELGSSSANVIDFTGSSYGYGSDLKSPQQISSRTAISLDGTVIGSQSDRGIGYGLGSFGTLIFEKLPESNQKTWNEHRITPVSLQTGEAGAEQVISLVIEEETKYTLQSVDEAKVVVAKSVRCDTVGGSSAISFHYSGEGTWTFDRVSGVPEEMQMNVTQQLKRSGKPINLTGTIRYERLKASNPSQWQTSFESELAKVSETTESDSVMPKIPKLDPLVLEEASDTEIGTWARNLRGKKKSYVEFFQPLQLLCRTKPTEKRRTEVSTALHNARTAFPTGQMGLWIRAVTVWGTEKNVPTLLMMLDSPVYTLEEKVLTLEAIGRLTKSKEAAEVLARCVPDKQLGLMAVAALTWMGKSAEAPATKLLDHPNAGARALACYCLAHVGSEKSVAAIEACLRKEREERYRAVMETSLDSLRKSLAKGNQNKPADKQ